MDGDLPLSAHDPELYSLIEQERERQRSGLELIASENFTSRAVMECLGSCLTNKYAEGLPGKRYYGGNVVIDQIETLCQTRALEAYRLKDTEWAVNVQPYSGSPANFAVYTALLAPHSRIMGLDLPSGGHLTHGFYTYSKKTGQRKSISATSIYFESMPYVVNNETGLIDYDALEKNAAVFCPALIVCGGSAYPREWDYARFRKIADSVGALLMADMAHISGLVAAEEADSPFEFCDIVTTTTHKSLRGPRAGMIFSKIDARGMPDKINFSVFPSLQGGPHEHQIAGIATQLKNVCTPEFKNYAKQVKSNCKHLAEALMAKGFKLCTDGSDNHLLLWDLKPEKLSGSKLERTCELINITLNKNCVVGDRSALTPGGVRIGTPSLTTRGFKEAEFTQVATFLELAVRHAQRIAGLEGCNKLRAFTKVAAEDAELAALKVEVTAFAQAFPMPGINGQKGTRGAALPAAQSS